MTVRLGELAETTGGEVRGDPERPIAGVRALDEAGPEHLSVLTDPRYRDRARTSRAGALLVATGAQGPRHVEGIERDLLIVEQPARALAEILDLLQPAVRPEPGIHPTAQVDSTATVAGSAHVGPYAVIGPQSEIEDGVVVESHTVVGRGCRIGEGSWLHPHVVLYDHTELGRRVRVHSGAVVGADGFRYVTVDGVHRKMPHVGRAVLGDDVEVGANSAVDRATLGATRVGGGTKIDNLVQVAHNVEIGRGAILCGQAGIAGSARLGEGVVLAGQVGVSDHVSLGDGVQVTAKSAVLGDVEAGVRVAGVPAVPFRQWRRQAVRLARLDEVVERLAAIERRIGAVDPGGEA